MERLTDTLLANPMEFIAHTTTLIFTVFCIFYVKLMRANSNGCVHKRMLIACGGKRAKSAWVKRPVLEIKICHSLSTWLQTYHNFPEPFLVVKRKSISGVTNSNKKLATDTFSSFSPFLNVRDSCLSVVIPFSFYSKTHSFYRIICTAKASIVPLQSDIQICWLNISISEKQLHWQLRSLTSESDHAPNFQCTQSSLGCLRDSQQSQSLKEKSSTPQPCFYSHVLNLYDWPLVEEPIPG